MGNTYCNLSRIAVRDARSHMAVRHTRSKPSIDAVAAVLIAADDDDDAKKKSKHTANRKGGSF